MIQMHRDLVICQAAYDIQYAGISKRINAEDDDYIKCSLRPVLDEVRLLVSREEAPTQQVDLVPSHAIIPATMTGLTTVPDDNDDDDEVATSTSTTGSMFTAKETLEQSDKAVGDEINNEHDLDGLDNLDDLDYLDHLQPNGGMESMDNRPSTRESP
ncbi:hypothetical protein N7447_000827 [Penicillium robsamsonii]|uniref:uncharacterized protein n=1 Tax=Penicillium robsamsonii TaxID=1792511 RepID=UPI0025472409|nr:uncharacterized protein N7447_000827 [Penicillium robsamsonii]KAJ5834801.1 hypothetical protein N7447_000827 [Penicillium robsamsonii]